MFPLLKITICDNLRTKTPIAAFFDRRQKKPMQKLGIPDMILEIVLLNTNIDPSMRWGDQEKSLGYVHTASLSPG